SYLTRERSDRSTEALLQLRWGSGAKPQLPLLIDADETLIFQFEARGFLPGERVIRREGNVVHGFAGDVAGLDEHAGDADVVRAAGLVGLLDEFFADCELIGFAAQAVGDDRADFIVGDHTGQTVGASQQNISGSQLFTEDVHLDLDARTHRARDD